MHIPMVSVDIGSFEEKAQEMFVLGDIAGLRRLYTTTAAKARTFGGDSAGEEVTAALLRVLTSVNRRIKHDIFSDIH